MPSFLIVILTTLTNDILDYDDYQRALFTLFISSHAMKLDTDQTQIPLAYSLFYLFP